MKQHHIHPTAWLYWYALCSSSTVKTWCFQLKAKTCINIHGGGGRKPETRIKFTANNILCRRCQFHRVKNHTGCTSISTVLWEISRFLRDSFHKKHFLSSIKKALHSAVFQRWTTFLLLTYTLIPQWRFIFNLGWNQEWKDIFAWKTLKQSRGDLKFLKHHFLSANLETDFREDNTVLAIFFLLRGLHSTLKLSHDYSPLAEGKRSE